MFLGTASWYHLTVIPEETLTAAADLLGGSTVTGDDVVGRLVAFQRANHPDRFQDAAAKQTATEAFTRASELIAKCRTAIENAEAGHQPTAAIQLASSAALSRPEFEVSSLLEQSVAARRQIDSLTTERDILLHKVETLTKSLAIRKTSGMAAARARAIRPYEPTRRSIAVTGVSIGFSLLLALLAQVETVTKAVLAPLHISAVATGYLLFLVFITTALIAGYKYWRLVLLQDAVARLCTTSALKRFYSRLSPAGAAGDAQLEFGEHDVAEFIRADLCDRGGLANATLARMGLYSDDLVELLKDLLIAHMLTQDCIEAGPSERLERRFRIRVRSRYVAWSDGASLLPGEEGGDLLAEL
jgi:hypothetical protein